MSCHQSEQKDESLFCFELIVQKRILSFPTMPGKHARDQARVFTWVQTTAYTIVHQPYNKDWESQGSSVLNRRMWPTTVSAPDRLPGATSRELAWTGRAKLSWRGQAEVRETRLGSLHTCLAFTSRCSRNMAHANI